MRIQIKRGSTLKAPFTILKDGQPLDLTASDFTGATLIYLVKASPLLPDASSVLSFTTTLTDGCRLVIVNAALGSIELQAEAERMRLPLSRYFGALQIRTAAGDVIEMPSTLENDEWQVTGHLVHAT